MGCRASSALALACLALAACAGDRPKRGFRPVADVPVKVGAPYKAGGRMWVPADDRRYDAVGLASWYGGAHAGRPTANGERFEPGRIGAAHPTLPLPSYVEVTALDSGRTILVRVNDRGPFVASRIIDLSAGAAKALGMKAQGVGRVRVRRVEPPEADRAALRAGRAARARPDANGATLAALDARFRAGSAAPRAMAPPRSVMSATLPQRSLPVQMGGPLYVQVAALADADRADGLAATLTAIGPSGTAAVGSLWQVRLGPYADATAARVALESVAQAGYQDARIVRESATGQDQP